MKRIARAGLYTGKIDGRKKITKAQARVIRRYADVASGKAAVVTPADPASYKNLFRVKGKRVIVPRGKGEKIAVNKRGNIVKERSVRGTKIRSTFRRVKHREELPPTEKGRVTMYAVPFIRGRDKQGKPILDWKRFPSLAMLKTFMEGYDYKDWTDYVIEENVDADHQYTVSAKQRERREKLSQSKRRFSKKKRQ